MPTIKMTVYGRVQGVGFRYCTAILAEKLNIKGWVKNNIDGSVEIVAQAPKDTMDKFIEAVKASPSPSGRVNKMEITDIEDKDLNRFSVRY